MLSNAPDFISVARASSKASFPTPRPIFNPVAARILSVAMRLLPSTRKTRSGKDRGAGAIWPNIEGAVTTTALMTKGVMARISTPSCHMQAAGGSKTPRGLLIVQLLLNLLELDGWRVLHGVIAGHFEHRRQRLQTIDVGQAIHGLAHPGITVLRHHHHLQIGRIPPLRHDLNGLFVAYLTRGNGDRRPRAFGLHT